MSPFTDHLTPIQFGRDGFFQFKNEAIILVPHDNVTGGDLERGLSAFGLDPKFIQPCFGRNKKIVIHIVLIL